MGDYTSGGTACVQVDVATVSGIDCGGAEGQFVSVSHSNQYITTARPRCTPRARARPRSSSSTCRVPAPSGDSAWWFRLGYSCPGVVLTVLVVAQGDEITFA